MPTSTPIRCLLPSLGPTNNPAHPRKKALWRHCMGTPALVGACVSDMGESWELTGNACGGGGPQHTVPVHGAIILNPQCTKCVLVQVRASPPITPSRRIRIRSLYPFQRRGSEATTRTRNRGVELRSTSRDTKLSDGSAPAFWSRTSGVFATKRSNGEHGTSSLDRTRSVCAQRSLRAAC